MTSKTVTKKSIDMATQTLTQGNSGACVRWDHMMYILFGEFIAMIPISMLIYYYFFKWTFPFDGPSLQEDQQRLGINRRRNRSKGYRKLDQEDNIEEHELQQYKLEVQKLKYQLELALREKDEALSRLSEIAARKLKDDNAAIADLSTENRPTKIVEKYKELYDNEWTEAFGELTDEYKMSERDTIQFLLKTLQAAYSFCGRKYAIRRKGMSLAVKSPDPAALKDEQIQGDESSPLTFECQDLVKQILKASAGIVVKHIEDKYQREKSQDVKYGRHTVAYIRKCAEITWFMNVQLPPMVIDDSPQRNSEYDTNIYSVYTKQGKQVDYLVWPVCRVEKGGLLLSKGILQPY